MTDFTKNMHETIASHFGLGSSTRGKTMDEHNRGRSEAEYRAEREPDEYWVNVYRDRRSKQLVTETNFTSLADAYENMLAGYTDCQYLHTIHVSKSATRRAPPDASAFNLEDDARAWLVERMGS